MTTHTQAFFTADDTNPSFAIKQALLARKMSVTELAGKLKRSRQATSIAIHHPARYPSLRARIEKVLA